MFGLVASVRWEAAFERYRVHSGGLAYVRGVCARVASSPTFALFAFNILAQAVTLLAAPILTRLYSPNSFGVLGSVTAVIMICVPLMTGRYELALPGAQSDREARTLLVLCCLLIVCGSILVGLAAYVISIKGPVQVLGVLSTTWFFLPIGLTLVALYDVLSVESSRQNNLLPLAHSKISQSVVGSGSQILLGFVGLTGSGLLWGFILNHAAGIRGLYRSLIGSIAVRPRISASELVACAHKHRRFPLWSSWTQALDLFVRWAVQFVFAVFWGPVVGGYLFLTERLVARPLMLVSSALLPVYISKLGTTLQEDSGAALGVFYRTLVQQILVALVWAMLVFFSVDSFMTPVFGPKWSGAVPYVQLMTLASLPLSCLHSVAHTLQILGYQRLDAALALFKASMIAVSVIGSYIADLSALESLKWVGLVQVVAAVVTFFCYRHALTAVGRSSYVVGDQRQRGL